MRRAFFTISIFAVSIFVFFVSSHQAYAIIREPNTAGTLMEVPDNHALVGVGHGSDDDRCTIWIKQGKLNANGTITDVSEKTETCYKGGAADSFDSSNKKVAPANSYITGWTWDADTDGGKYASDDDRPENACYFQQYRKFDPITKVLGTEYGWNGTYDGTCNEGEYIQAWLQKYTAADSGKVIIGLGMLLGDDANIDDITIKYRTLNPSYTVTGKVYRTDTGVGFGGATISTCRDSINDPGGYDPESVTTKTDGTYSFTVTAPYTAPTATAFCARVSPLTRSGFTGPVVVMPAKTPPWTSYESQFAGRTAASPDRSVDTGYDFKYTPVGSDISVVLRGSTTSSGWVDSMSQATGIDPYIIDFQADVTGGAGLIDYRFYCRKTDTAANQTRFAQSTEPYNIINLSCAYPSSATTITYEAKVSITRDGLTREDILPITITAPSTPTGVTLTAATDNTTFYNPLKYTGISLSGVDLKADVTGGSGSIRYRFYCNSSSTTVAKDVTISTSPYSPYKAENVCSYSSPGTYTAKVTITRNLTDKSNTVNIIISPLGVTMTTTPTTGVAGETEFASLVTVTPATTEVMDYLFWFDCPYEGTVIADAKIACHDLPDPSTITPRSCKSNEYGWRCNDFLSTEKTYTFRNIYTTSGTKKPKVIIQQPGTSASAPTAQAQNTVTVSSPPGPTLTASLTASPCTTCGTTDSDNTPVTLTGEAGGTETSSTINYSFWWDCDRPENTVGDLDKDKSLGGCGDLENTCAPGEFGFKCDDVDSPPPPPNFKSTDPHSYYAGTTVAKVIIERGSATPAEDRLDITVVSVDLKGATNAIDWVDFLTSTTDISSGVIDFKADVTGGSGSMIYNFYCKDTDLLPFTSISKSTSPHIITDTLSCSYASPPTDFKAKVTIDRDGKLEIATDYVYIHLEPSPPTPSPTPTTTPSPTPGAAYPRWREVAP